MTSVRPEHEEGAQGAPYGAGAGYDPYGQGAAYGRGSAYEQTAASGQTAAYEQTAASGQDPYGVDPEFQAAVDALADPLSDPLPGRQPEAPQQPEQQAPHVAEPPQDLADPQGVQGEPGKSTEADGNVSPWFRTQAPAHGRTQPAQPSQTAGPIQETPYPQQPVQAAHTTQDQPPQQTYPAQRTPQPHPQPHAQQPPQPRPSSQEHARPLPEDPARPQPVRERPESRPGTPAAAAAAQPAVDWGRDIPGTAGYEAGREDDRRTVGLRKPVGPEAEPESGGRAARRRAAKANRGWSALVARARTGGGAHARTAAPAAAPVAAGTRLEARRAERARREGPAIIASRFVGEAFISLGVLMLLFVAYQLWWTNVLAGQKAGGEASELQDQWKDKPSAQADPERRAGQFAPGEGFAIIHIPKLDIDTPIAQGVSKEQVLDKGLVGHYDQKPLKTAMPWDKKGNFALAGHRNTHGEPFRYINRLVVGDEIVVETASKYYTYKMTNRLASTSPSNTSVIDPVPQQSGFDRSGRYITLTTCTPEFTSKYRLIVWGNMVDERPRSEGKPDALVN